MVVDPFMGSGTAALAAALEGCQFYGCDVEKRYIEIARTRVTEARKGSAKYRPLERPLYVSSGNESVARIPPNFKFAK